MTKLGPLYYPNIIIVVILIVIAIIDRQEVKCDCGCLKCSRDLEIVSSPNAPCQIIYRREPHICPAPMPYSVQVPLPKPAEPLPILKAYDYRIEAVPLYENREHLPSEYTYEVQTPLQPIPLPSPRLTGLLTLPDRIVLPTPTTCCQQIPEPIRKCRPLYATAVFEQQFRNNDEEMPSRRRFQRGPLLERLIFDDDDDDDDNNNFGGAATTSCRYDYNVGRRRAKRDLPLLTSSVRLLFGLLPNFVQLPIKQTLKSFQPKIQLVPSTAAKRKRKKNNATKNKKKYQKEISFLEKLEKLNGINNEDDESMPKRRRRRRHRSKRRAIQTKFDDDDTEMILPFFKVTDVEDEDEEEDYDDDDDDNEDDEEILQKTKQDFLQPFNFNHLFPQNPLFYLINAPIRFLHHFHNFGRQFRPLVRSVPLVMIKSKHYLKNFGRDLKTNIANIASNLIGDFDNNPHQVSSTWMAPSRFRRNAPSMRTATTQPHRRTKRYILKMVDEDEVQEFLREKLGGLVRGQDQDHEPPTPLSPPPSASTSSSSNNNKSGTERRKKTRKKFVVEKLSSKIIFDNNGRPFVEIDGNKQPIFLNNHKNNKVVKETRKNHGGILEGNDDKNNDDDQEEEEGSVETKITNLIEKIKQQQNHQDAGTSSTTINNPNDYPISKQIIREKIAEILATIQTLIDVNFDDYAPIYNDLLKLDEQKRLVVSIWKKLVIEEYDNNKSNQIGSMISSKIRLLDALKDLQQLKDTAVHSIARNLLLNEQPNRKQFLTKKLIRMLVRLQKLQCVIVRVVDEFSENIPPPSSGGSHSTNNGKKYIEYLANLKFINDSNNKNQSASSYDLDLEDLIRERDAMLANAINLLEKLRQLLEMSGTDRRERINEEAKLLWEIKNIEKLQVDAIGEMNEKIARDRKIRKELKILFDLQKQLETCEAKQWELLEEEDKAAAASDEEDGFSRRRQHQARKSSEEQRKSIGIETNPSSGLSS